MSAQATGWALSQPGLSPTEKLVLIGLADHAGPDGRRAYPSVETLEGYVGRGRRVVQRALRTLQDRGLIFDGDQRHVGHYRPDRRPHVYDLALDGVTPTTPRTPGGVSPTTPRAADGVSSTAPTGCRPRPNGVSSTTPKPKDLTQTPEPKDLLIDESIDDDEPAAPSALFEQFWNTYPRKVGKRTAAKAWGRSIKAAAAEAIIAAAARYRDDPNRLAEFTAHPTTWLNRGGWDDDPLPPRSRSAQHAAYVDPPAADYSDGWTTPKEPNA